MFPSSSSSPDSPILPPFHIPTIIAPQECSYLSISLSLSIYPFFFISTNPEKFHNVRTKASPGGLLKKLIDAIKDLVTDANFDCSSSGFSLQAIDSSHIAFVSLDPFKKTRVWLGIFDFPLAAAAFFCIDDGNYHRSLDGDVEMIHRPATSVISSTVESYSGPRVMAIVRVSSTATNKPRPPPVLPKDCRSDCDSSLSVVDDCDGEIACSSSSPDVRKPLPDCVASYTFNSDDGSFVVELDNP